MFHRFHASGERPTGQGSLTETQFEAVIRSVGLDRILPPEEWLVRLQRGALKPEHVCITFDDGLASQYRVALPVLVRLGLRAFWFVYSSIFHGRLDRNEIYNFFSCRYFASFDDYVQAVVSRCSDGVRGRLAGPGFDAFVADKAMFPFYTAADLRYRYLRDRLLSRREFERIVDGLLRDSSTTVEEIGRASWLTEEQVGELHHDGHCIGLHSFDHPYEMVRLTVEEQRQQYIDNYRDLSRIAGSVNSMSHPLNSYDHRTLAILKEMGIVCGFRSSMEPPPGSVPNSSPLELAREDSANLARRLYR